MKRQAKYYGLGGEGVFSFLTGEMEIRVSNLDPEVLVVKIVRPIQLEKKISLSLPTAFEQFKQLMISAWEQTDYAKLYHDFRPVSVIRDTMKGRVDGYLAVNSYYFHQERFIKDFVKPLFKTYIEEYRVVRKEEKKIAPTVMKAIELAKNRIPNLKKLIA